MTIKKLEKLLDTQLSLLSEKIDAIGHIFYILEKYYYYDLKNDYLCQGRTLYIKNNFVIEKLKLHNLNELQFRISQFRSEIEIEEYLSQYEEEIQENIKKEANISIQKAILDFLTNIVLQEHDINLFTFLLKRVGHKNLKELKDYMKGLNENELYNLFHFIVDIANNVIKANN
jgi:hypothetical protein